MKLKRKAIGGKYKDLIPNGLTTAEEDVYTTILNTVEKRSQLAPRRVKTTHAEDLREDATSVKATTATSVQVEATTTEAFIAEAERRKSPRLAARSNASQAETLGPETLLKETPGARTARIGQRQARLPDHGPPRIVVITDLAKDFDDLLAMIVLKELHRLGAIRLLGFVANLKPADRRARLGRGALDQLGLTDVPMAIGTDGLERGHKHKVLDYEFRGSETFIAPNDRNLPDGQDLLKQIFQDAKQQDYMVTLLTLSSLMDIALFMDKNRELLADRLERCVLQGGYTITENKQLVADLAATNNNFAPLHAQRFHTFLYEEKIPSTCFTKVATFATPIFQNLLNQMANTKVPVGKYLQEAQIGQDLYFWQCASGPEEERFRPFMDEEWFLKNKTTWYSSKKRPAEVPEGDGIVKWLDKVTAYDCLAAVGTAEDILGGLGVVLPLEVRTDAIHDVHQTVGVLEELEPGTRVVRKPAEANVDGNKFALVIRALAIGSLKAVAQGLQSNRY